MLKKPDISRSKHVLIVYLTLTFAVMAVFWQLNRYDFINFDDPLYVTENDHIKSGFTPKEIRWAFTTTYVESWHPLTWLSLMLDYQLYGLNPGGYHATNVIIHLFSTLLLFGLLKRMTGAVWKSAFVAAFFALHPIHVESVARISERKDVLSAFFWMLTLYLYVYYTEKPVIKRYLPVIFSFALGLISKPMLVTLPVIMILLDYWPLKRFESQKGNPVLWQLKEKIPFFILSAVSSLFTIYAQTVAHIIEWPPLTSLATNALASFMTYIFKTLWPFGLTVCYPLKYHLPAWQILAAVLLILLITGYVILNLKRHPYFFVGWLWYSIVILPVIGIFRAEHIVMTDHYTYLPTIGIGICLAWGIPSLIRNKYIFKKIVFYSAIAVVTVLAVLTWQQCHYWKNSFSLFSHTLEVKKDNYLALNNIANYLAEKGKMNEALDYYREAIRINPDFAEVRNNRGNLYNNQGQYQLAVDDYNEAIRLKPDYADAFNNRGSAFAKMGMYQNAFEDFNKSFRLKLTSASLYNNLGMTYFQMGRYQQAVECFDMAVKLQKYRFEAYYNRGRAYAGMKQYQEAIENYNKAIALKPDNAGIYKSAGVIYFKQEDPRQGCRFARKACELGDCKLLEMAKKKNICP